MSGPRSAPAETTSSTDDSPSGSGRSSARGQAAVDDEFGAGDEAGLVRQEINAHVGDLGGGAEPAERNVAGDAGASGVGKVRLFQHQIDHRAIEKGRMYGVA